MITNNAKNLNLTKAFDEYYPVAHSNFRCRVRPTEHMIFAQSAKAGHVKDVDGNDYIDFLGSFGPTMLGHCNPDYVSALEDHLEKQATVYCSGLVFTPEDIELAQLITKYVPCAEMVKLSLSGTEAVQTAIRLARAYTGKNTIVRFADHYHGWLDNVLGGIIDNSAERPWAKQSSEDSAYTIGRFPGAREESFLLPWNDFDALEETVKKYHDEIAIIHFEAIVCNHFALLPKPGFLEKIRELCDEYNIVMSIDEVITGFRVGIGGAQSYLGVTPDICTFGKAISAGIPFSAVAGKKEIMMTFRDERVLGPGTYNGYALGVKAAVTALKLLSANDCSSYEKMEVLQKKLTDGLLKSAKRHNIPMSINQAPGVFYTIFGIEGKTHFYTEADLEGYDAEMNDFFWSEVVKEGILLLMSCKWYMNFAHTEKDVTDAIAAVDRVFSRMEDKYKK